MYSPLSPRFWTFRSLRLRSVTSVLCSLHNFTESVDGTEPLPRNPEALMIDSLLPFQAGSSPSQAALGQYVGHHFGILIITHIPYVNGMSDKCRDGLPSTVLETETRTMSPMSLHVLIGFG